MSRPCTGLTSWNLFSIVPQKLELPKAKGQLLIFGATNWDLIGRKEVPKQQGVHGHWTTNLADHTNGHHVHL